MTAQETLAKLEHERVEAAEHLVDEIEAETRKRGFMKLNLRKLEALEDDAWKNVTRIDEHLGVIQDNIELVYYYDEWEMPANDKVGMLAALISLKNRIIAIRNKMTDTVIRKIVEREKSVMLATSLRNGGGSIGDEEE